MRMTDQVVDEEKKALRFIARRESRGDSSPGVREIGYVVGLDSLEEVQGLLGRLADRGYLLQDADWWRMLRLTERGWQLAKDSNAAAEAKGRSDNDGLPGSPNIARRHLLC